MPMRKHVRGICTCRKRHPKHWTAAEVDYLERNYGRRTDAAIAKALGRSLDGVDVKAGRLGLAVESGISTFEAEFLANTMMPDGSTFGQWALPQMEQVYETREMPPLLISLDGPVALIAAPKS